MPAPQVNLYDNAYGHFADNRAIPSRANLVEAVELLLESASSGEVRQRLS